MLDAASAVKSKMFVLKLHKAKDGRVLAAVCDEELLGQKFEEGRKQLDLSGDFYKGEKKSGQEIGDVVRNADFVYLAGERSVNLGIQEGIIDPGHVLKIAGVPHAQAVIEH